MSRFADLDSRLVVTGGAGFIGSALIWGLNKQGFDNIIVVEKLGVDDKWRNLVGLQFRELIDKDRFITGLEKNSYSPIGIIHIGAITDTTEQNAELLIEDNYEYTKRLCLWSVRNAKRFIYASSAATYGDGSKGFRDDNPILPDLRPLNIYAYSKHLFDLWALRNGLLGEIAGLKYFNVFGPNEYHKGEMRSIVHKAFEQINRGGTVRLFRSHNPKYKNGWQMRDFIYVKDVVDMTLSIYNNKDANGIFNIGTGIAHSFYDLVAAVFKAMEREPRIEYIDIPEPIRDRYQYWTQADMRKTEAIYKKDLFSLEQGVDDYIKNYLLTDDPYLAGEGGGSSE